MALSHGLEAEVPQTMTMNTSVPNMSGIQPPSRILNRFDAKNAKSTARNRPLAASAGPTGQRQRPRMTL